MMKKKKIGLAKASKATRKRVAKKGALARKKGLKKRKRKR